MNRDLHIRGFHSAWMIDPGAKVDPNYFVYKSGTENDVWVKTADGKNFHGDAWPGAAAFPDFTSPKVNKWWRKMCIRDRAGLIRNSYQTSILRHSYEWQKYHLQSDSSLHRQCGRELVDWYAYSFYTLHIHGYQTKEPNHSPEKRQRNNWSFSFRHPV